MTIEYIIDRFIRNRYRVCRDMNSGKIVVTTPMGLSKSFHSYREAYQFFFNR